MNAYHLRKSEVIYELKIRGLSTIGDSAVLRKRLHQCLAEELAVDESVVNSLDTEQELEECETLLTDLVSLVDNYEGNYRDNEYNRLVARLYHLALRSERIPIGATADGELERRKEHLVNRTKHKMDYLTGTRKGTFLEPAEGNALEVGRQLTQLGTLPAAINLLDQDIGEDDLIPRNTVAETTHNLADIQPSQGRLNDRLPGYHPIPYPTRTRSNTSLEHLDIPVRTRSVPVYKWGLQFDMDSGGSIGAFLERVEEVRRARGVSHNELFESAVDLFTGQALVWYRSIQSRIRSWQELCSEMQTVFQKPDYQFRLQQEIFNRVQGDRESIDMYIASMEGLYSRLPAFTPESVRLAQMLNNLHPYLQDRLSLFDINSLDTLRSMGRKAEAGRFRSVFPRPSPRSNSVLEPDLAYKESTTRKGPPTGRVFSIQPQKMMTQSVKCWNCGQQGHRYSNCQKVRKRFCFGCGVPDTLKANCTKCNPKNA